MICWQQSTASNIKSTAISTTAKGLMATTLPCNGAFCCYGTASSDDSDKRNENDSTTIS